MAALPVPKTKTLISTGTGQGKKAKVSDDDDNDDDSAEDLNLDYDDDMYHGMGPVGIGLTQKDEFSEQTEFWQKYSEERRGLINNKVQFDKYSSEAFLELQSAYIDDADDIARKLRQEEDLATAKGWQKLQELTTKAPTQEEETATSEERRKFAKQLYD